MYNVLLVEDDPMARQLLEIYVNKSEKYHLSGSVESASAFVPRATASIAALTVPE